MSAQLVEEIQAPPKRKRRSRLEIQAARSLAMISRRVKEIKRERDLIPKYIDKMGIEIEGGYLMDYGRPLWANRDDINVRDEWLQPPIATYLAIRGECQRDGSIAGLGDKILPIEAVSKPLKVDALKNWIQAIYPGFQNASCGTHIHVSLNKKQYYDRLAEKHFYYWFLSQAEYWFQSNVGLIPSLKRDKVVWQWINRLDGDNCYCCPNYVASCEHFGGSRRRSVGGCEHECDWDSGCYNYLNCSHDCNDREEQRLAIDYQQALYIYSNQRVSSRRNTNCLIHECAHQDHLEHDDCLGFRECFRMNQCFHDHRDECEQNICDHSHDTECGGLEEVAAPGSGCHIPELQRKLDHKAHERYAHINYCERLHGTIEFRLFPAFNSADMTASCVQFVHDAIEEYLSREWDLTVEEVVKTENVIRVVDGVNDANALEFRNYVADMSGIDMSAIIPTLNPYRPTAARDAFIESMGPIVTRIFE